MKRRNVKTTEVPAYMLGSVAMDAEDMLAKQWLAHPTMFDVAVTVGAVANMVLSIMDESSPLGSAIKTVIDAHKAKANKPPSTTENEGIQVEPVMVDARPLIDE